MKNKKIPIILSVLGTTRKRTIMSILRKHFGEDVAEETWAYATTNGQIRPADPPEGLHVEDGDEDDVFWEPNPDRKSLGRRKIAKADS